MLNIEQISAAFNNIEANSADLRLYALIDHSGMPGLVKKLAEAKHPWVSLFHGSTEEHAIEVAPILLPLHVNPATQGGRRIARWICERGTYTSSLLLMASPLDMDELARRLAIRLDAVLPDDMAVLLRYFDTRIFEMLMTVLDVSQKADFLGPAHQWCYVDRRGVLQTAKSTFAAEDKFAAPLALSVAQQNMLIDASEPDQIAELLLSTLPDEYGQRQYQDRFDFIMRHSLAAQALGVHATHEKSFYCALALLYGEDFSFDKSWRSGLAEVKAGNLTLQQLVEQMEEKND